MRRLRSYGHRRDAHKQVILDEVEAFTRDLGQGLSQAVAGLV